MGESGKGMSRHKGTIEKSGIGSQRVLPKGFKQMAVQQAGQGSGTAAARAVKPKKGIQDTVWQGNMWQEHIGKKCPCHNTYAQENTSQKE